MGSTEYDEEYVDISGVTIESPSAYVEAGVAFFNSSGRIADSIVGPLKRVSAGELAAKPHGYGVIATNSLIGAGSGTAERQVTVVNSKVFGYQWGGIRFDDARGTDASATTREPSGIKEVGYVKGTTVEGSGASTVIPQVGIQYHAGATGSITASKVTGNMYTTEQRKSAGILLTGVGAGFSVSGSLISGNGYGLFNADVKNEVVREGAPALATGNFWGTHGTPITGPTATTTIAGPPKVEEFEEGISGEDAATNPSVVFSAVLGSAPTVAAVPPLAPDSAPVGAIVNPGDGETVDPGTAIEPVVLAEDDYGVRTVSLTADGAPLGARAEAPYAFNWTPSAADAGRTVTLQATITDSAGQVTTSTIEVPVKAAAVTPPPKTEPPVTIEPAPAPPSGGPRPGKVTSDKVKGTATLTITVPGAGKLVVSGDGIKKVTKQVKAAGKVTVTIKAKGEALATLNEDGKVAVKVTITYTATGGAPKTKTKTVVLKKTT
jgi:hypothetical protein